MKALTVSQTALVFIGVMIGLTAIGEGAGSLVQWASRRRLPPPVTQQQAEQHERRPPHDPLPED